ncbi:MAG: SPOR domain-containing protein [Rubrivivax sp.]
MKSQIRLHAKSHAKSHARLQRGSFAVGLLVGVLAGLVLALGVAMYVNQVPVPFINKVPQRTAEQDAAEVERNRTWNPNAPLSPKAAARAAAPTPGSTPPPAVATAAPAPRPASTAATGPTTRANTGDVPRPAAAPTTVAAKPSKPGAEPFTYFAQAGAYSRAEDAQAQRAKLALMGLDARIIEREQAGRTVYRVRLGPYEQRPEADAMLERLGSASVESTLVRVERQ